MKRTTKGISVDIELDDHAVFEEEARRLTAKGIGRVTLGDVLRRGLARDAARLRNKHKSVGIS